MLVPPHETVVDLRGVRKSFGSKTAVRGASFSVQRGEIVGFLGPNGAGKTTVMNMVAGLIAPDDGEIAIFGVLGGLADPAVRSRMAFLQEGPRLYPEMTGRAYLQFFASLHGLNDATPRVGELLGQMSLDHAADRAVGTYSRGMQQRLCLARTMLHRPVFMVLDEPTLGLDPSGVREIRDVIQKLNRDGVAFLFSSHQLAEMERICNRIILMNEGHVIASGTREDISRSLPGATWIIAEVDAVGEGLIAAARGLKGVTSVECHDARHLVIRLDTEIRTPEMLETFRVMLSRALTGAGAAVLAVTVQATTLEEAFLAMTAKEPLNAIRN